jgi:hypothetical protein
MKKYLVILFVSISFSSCTKIKEKSQLSLVLISGDSAAVYNGPINKYGKIYQFPLNENTVKQIIETNKNEYGIGLELIIKPAPCGDGNVGDKMQMLLNLLKQENVAFHSTLLLTSDESKYFHTSSRELQ